MPSSVYLLHDITLQKTKCVDCWTYSYLKIGETVTQQACQETAPTLNPAG